MKIQFLKDTSMAVVPDIEDLLVVYQEKYDIPKADNATFIPWREYKYAYTSHEYKNVMLIGINRMITPQNRCDMVNEYLQTMTQSVNKWIVDKEPFIGDPWRLWFHFSIARGEFLGINYSYPIEGDWLKWFLRDQDSSMIDAENLRLQSYDDVYSDIDKVGCDFDFYSPSSDDVKYYNAVKDAAFDKYTSPKSLIQFMMKEMSNLCDKKLSYDMYRNEKSAKLPDFPVCRFIAQENKRRVDIYNVFSGVNYGN